MRESERDRERARDRYVDLCCVHLLVRVRVCANARVCMCIYMGAHVRLHMNVCAFVCVSRQQQLKLYALFKQATVGTCNTYRPGLLDFVGTHISHAQTHTHLHADAHITAHTLSLSALCLKCMHVSQT